MLIISLLSAQHDHHNHKKCTHEHKGRPANDTTIKVVQSFHRDDDAGEAIIIQRYRDDTLADKWLKEYIQRSRNKITENIFLKGTKASGCSNLDFENGNFSNWTCQTATNYNYPAGDGLPSTNETTWSGTAPVANRHVITNAASGNDPYGNFPMLAPNGGSFSVKLGNNSSNNEAEQLVYTFFVNPQDTNFIYKYAIVLENPDPPHTWAEQPYFELKIYDGSNNVIPCSYQQYSADGSIPGFFDSPSNSNIKCKSWTTVGVNLGPYVGQTITLVVTSADCAQGAHFGYGYIDFICPSSFTSTPNVYCNNVTSATLTVPDIDPGMNFQWSTGETTPTITINPQNYDGSNVSVYIQSPTSLGLCGFYYLFPIEVVQLNPEFNTTTNCLTVNFTDLSSVTGTTISGWSWDFGDGQNSTSQNPTHTYTTAGDYNVTLTITAGGCQNSISHHVTVSGLSISVSSINPMCYGQNGSATVTASGSGSYSYTWSTTPPQTTATANNLPPGTYTVSVSEPGGCNNTASVTITQPPQMQTTTSQTNVTCYGYNDGSATVNVSGGTGTYTYQWSNAQTNSTATNLAANSYTVTVKDGNNCSTTASVTITQPPQLTISATASPGSICPGASSTLTANGAVTYAWDNGIGNGNPQTVSPANTTAYHVTGTDATGCTATATVSVVVYTPPTISITGNNSVCQGQSTTLSGNGATSYVWDIGNNTSSITITPTATTTYLVTGTDANGCTGTASYQVTVIPMPDANAGLDATQCGLTYNLSAIPSVGNGTWTSPQNVTINPVNNPNATLTVNQTGQYTLIWTENNQGCIDADTVIINLTRYPTSEFTADTIPCAGNNSMITFTGFAEGNSVYTWSWDGGNSIPGTGAGPHVVNWNSTGIHTVSLTVSTNGCASPPTTVQIYNPAPLSSSLTKTDILCYGDANGKVDLTVTGGRLPYSFQWDNGAPTEDLLNIPAGIYTVTVTDASGCTKTDGITINQPAQLVASVTPTQYICIGQPAYLSITATGGTPSYQYFWNGQSSNPSIAVYPEVTTTYTASVVDANGCSSSLLSTTVYVAPPLHVNLLANTDHVCPGDPVMLTPVIWGGVGPPYIIYNQDGDVVTPPIYIYPNQSGWYGVRVEDACGSWDTSSVFIHVWPLPPASILADTLQGCVPLTVHFIEVNPDSGQTYLWDFGDQSNLSLSKNPVHTYTTSGTFDVTITVTSNHGCKTTVVYNDMITVWPKPNAAYVWSPEVVTEIKPVLNFTNMSTGAAWYQWMFGDGDSSSVVNPEHRYPGKGDYETQLVAVSNKGCTDTAKAIIKILEQYTFYAPTAFSPDGDRNNDFFYVVAHGIKEEGFYLEVYDRWGEIIWSTKQYSKMDERSEKWDGRAKNHEIVPIGTYTWRAVFRDNFDKLHEEVGAVSIIR